MRKCVVFNFLAFILVTIVLGYAKNVVANEVYRSRQWRDMETRSSVLVNPSFAAYCDWITVSSVFSITQLNRFFLTNLQAVLPLTPFAYKSQTIGIGYLGYNSGKFDRTSWNQGRIIKEDRANQYSEHYGTINYALRPFQFMAVGTNINIAYQSNFSNEVIDAAFDLGLSFNFKSPIYGNYLLGINLLNPARISRFEVPLYSPDAGISCFFEKEIKKIAFDGGIELNYRSFWGENSANPHFDITGRIGAKLNNFLQLYLQAGTDYAGFSVKFNRFTKSLPKIMNNASTAIQVLFTKDQFRPTNSVFFSGQFGTHRNVITGEANDIYYKAQIKMAENKFWDAYAYFSLLEKEYPDFSKNDEVRLRSAMCLENLYMYEKSIEKYKGTKSLYIDDGYEDEQKIKGAADLGLLRIIRHSADSQKVIEQFNLLEKSAAYDSIKEHGWYELGQFYFEKKDWFSAIDALENVSTDHYDYPFAQYSIAICKFMTDASPREIKRIFNEVIAFDAKTVKQLEIIYKAKYTLGCIYYEENEFANAQRFLQQIPDSSDIYYDALVVIGWAMLRSQLWEKCRQIAEVMQNCNIPDVQAEGFILEEYTLLKDSTMIQNRSKGLSHSIQQINKANMVIPSLNYFLNINKDEIDLSIDSIAKEISSIIDNFHKSLESNIEHQFIIKSLDNLRESIENRCSKITNFYYHIDIARHYKSHEERIKAIINDIEYLSAKYKLLYDREQKKSVEMPDSTGMQN